MRSSPFFVALDLPSGREALDLASRLRPVTRRFKVGLELFTAEGPGIVTQLAEQGDEVFLDLKLHDIPRTTAGAVRSVCRLGASWLTLHASGGRGMVRAAAEAAAGEAQAPRLLAVTVLTSLNAGDLDAIGMEGDVQGQVDRLARLSLQAGADGIVCSPRDVRRLRKHIGDGPAIVCPGVRPEGSAAGDQKRVATPEEAMSAGADLLVIGRPITASEDPVAAARHIAEALES